MVEFKKDESLSAEEAFWVMWYFIQDTYELTDGDIEVSEILSFCEPLSGDMMPADSGVIGDWNKAIEKYRKLGVPKPKNFQ